MMSENHRSLKLQGAKGAMRVTRRSCPAGMHVRICIYYRVTTGSLGGDCGSGGLWWSLNWKVGGPGLVQPTCLGVQNCL